MMTQKTHHNTQNPQINKSLKHTVFSTTNLKINVNKVAYLNKNNFFIFLNLKYDYDYFQRCRH